jgi:hypothetical protein
MVPSTVSISRHEKLQVDCAVSGTSTTVDGAVHNERSPNCTDLVRQLVSRSSAGMIMLPQYICCLVARVPNARALSRAGHQARSSTLGFKSRAQIRGICAMQDSCIAWHVRQGLKANTAPSCDSSRDSSCHLSRESSFDSSRDFSCHSSHDPSCDSCLLYRFINTVH